MPGWCRPTHGRRLPRAVRRAAVAGSAGLLAAAVVVALALVPDGARAAFTGTTGNTGNELVTEAAFPDYRTAALGSGPVVYHPFDDPWGSSVAAASRGTAGTYNGAAAPTSVSPGAVAWTTATPRRAVSFPSGTFADATSTTTLTGAPLKVTLEAWVRTGHGGAVASLVSSAGTATDPGDVQLYVNGLGEACVGITLLASATQRVCGSDPDDTKVWTSTDQASPVWHQVVAVIDPSGTADSTSTATDGTQVMVYVDGGIVFDRGLTGTWPSSLTGQLRVGTVPVRAGSAPATWSGDIDEVAVYGSALSAAQVKNHYDEGTDVNGATTTTYPGAVTATSPTVWWRLEETPGPGAGSIADAVAGGPTGTFHGYPDLPVAGAPTGTATPGTGVGLSGVNGISTGATRSTPAAFSTEVWFNSAGGTGPLVGFTPTAASNVPDRAVYLTAAGDLAFRVVSPARTLLAGGNYRDGQWHLVTATMSAAGQMSLYVDGALKASDGSAAAAASGPGLWRWGGGGTYTSYPTPPGAPFFTGLLDEASVYDLELSAEDVAVHWGAKF